MIDPQYYGPWAVIAGGSEGVGAGFADELSKIGINLVLIARKPPARSRRPRPRARANGVEVRTLALDLLVPDALDQIKAVTDDVEVGLLIFNAGANSYGHEFVTGDLTGFAGVIELNINKQLELSHHFGGLMKDRGRGGIMLLGSLAGFMGSEHQSNLRGVQGIRAHLRRKPVARTPAVRRSRRRVHSRCHSHTRYDSRGTELRHPGHERRRARRCCT